MLLIWVAYDEDGDVHYIARSLDQLVNNIDADSEFSEEWFYDYFD